MAGIFQMGTNSAAQEKRQEEEAENRHPKVKTALFSLDADIFLRQQEKGILFFSPSLPRLYKM